MTGYIRKMTDIKMNPLTKLALENIAGDLKVILTSLNASTREAETVGELDRANKYAINIMKNITACLTNLTILILGDAYTYTAVVDGQTSQVPVASREQFASGVVNQSSETVVSDISTTSKSLNRPVVHPRDNIKSNGMFSTRRRVEKSTPKSSSKSSQNTDKNTKVFTPQLADTSRILNYGRSPKATVRALTDSFKNLKHGGDSVISSPTLASILARVPDTGI